MKLTEEGKKRNHQISKKGIARKKLAVDYHIIPNRFRVYNDSDSFGSAAFPLRA